ncbi:MAG: Na/Pi cotransporter family protein [Clostridia bacterium]|nr:Na/Pi cotransporter family protein [Clostridia bacterium]
MTATQILIMVAELLGGLTFFLFGMNVMSGGLEQMAGGALERTLKKVTKNDVLSFFLGAGITIAIQSSSAMTVMLVGLVNSGIMGFADTFGMIMGSHVGTTLTAWILTLGGISGDNFILTLLRPMTFAPILAFAGIIMRMLSQKEKRRNLGTILIGFAVLMAGMDMMSASMETFRTDPSFKKLLTAFTSPMIAFLASTLFTGVIQSSAATVAIVQSLALAMLHTNNPITYQIAIPLVIGANVGTCMTALISSFGTNREAKRVVAMHIYTNAIGGIICVILMYAVMAISPNLMSHSIGIIGVATVHSLFNIANTIAFIPFKKPLLRLCEKTIRKSDDKTHTVFLDERLFYNPTFAIPECRRLTVEMAELARKSLLNSISLIDKFDDEISNSVRETENIIDKYEDKLGTYLVKISSTELSETDSHTVGRLLHGIGDFERIGDHALNIRDAAQEIRDKDIVFSKDAKSELTVIINALIEILNITVDSFVSDDLELASKVEPLEQVIDKLKDELRARHIERLQNGNCTIQLGFVFSDLLTNFERVSDHCSNIAVYTMQRNDTTLDMHRYLKNIKFNSRGSFEDKFKEYDKKYSI